VVKQEHSGPDGGPMEFDLDSWKDRRKERLAQVEQMDE